MVRLRGRLLAAVALLCGGLLLQGIGRTFLQAFRGDAAACYGPQTAPRKRARSQLSRIPRRQQDVSTRGSAELLGDIATSRADSYQLLSQREHVLHRPDMYIGPVEPREDKAWVLTGQKIVEERLTMSPGFVQIFNEILVNAIDRQFQSGMSEIRVDVDHKAGRISISNDGGPIPIEKHESGDYVPTLVFGQFLSGNNFNDTEVRYTGGRNGVGAKATNAFSRVFEVEVDDPGTGIRFFQRWENNMLDLSEPKMTKLPKSVKQGRVTVSFKPDLARFGLRKIDSDHVKIMKARAFDAAACTKPGIAVYFNGKELPTQNFEEYSKRLLGKTMAVTKVLDAEGNVRAEVAAGFAGEDGFAALGFVNGMRCSRGTHIDYAVKQLSESIARMAVEGTSKPTPAMVKQYLRVVVKVLVDNPDFDSQTKTRLTTTTMKLGFDFVIPTDFVTEVAELGVLQAAIRASQAAQQRVMQQVLTNGAAPSLGKLEDAELAGKPGKECTLILTEGDSAKALAVAGLAKIGRAHYGVFPLKGKPLNVRSATEKQIQNNQEIKNLMHILGLEWGRGFNSAEEVESLRYQKVMIFSDQDLDGHHITGLILNLFLAEWPSLLEVKPDFIQRFATPLVKAFPKGNSKIDTQEFFTQGEFEAWQRSTGPDWVEKYGAKYYKGLGTSTREEALGYFADMNRHVMDFTFEGAEDKEMVEKVFEPSRANDRKTWLREYSADAELDYTREQSSYSDFLNLQMVHFSTYDNVRSIPLLIDGLKPSQRKVLHWALKHLRSEKKVSQIVGLVSSATNYHHGEESLVKVIVHLAQDFVGSNNLNLLQPVGMFGTRLNGRDVHASARYIHTKLPPLVSKIFVNEDLDLLPPQQEDGQPVEPRALLPIIPLILINGFSGIGTGWSTQGPNFDPLEVAASLEQLIRGKRAARLAPSYRGFQGEVVEQNGKFHTLGKWTMHSTGVDQSPDYVEITELPIGVWTEDFIEAVEKKAKNKNFNLRVHKCSDHDDQNVHLLIGFDPDEILKTADVKKDIEQVLGLRKSLPTNMMLYEIPDLDSGAAAARLEQFQDANAVLETFYRARLPFYQMRKDKMQQKISQQVTKLSNQVRCIQMCKEESLSFSELCACGLQERGFDRMDVSAPDDKEQEGPNEDGFDYILKMPISKLSDEKAAELAGRLAAAREELQRIEALAPEEMWLEDLDRFRQAYTKALPKPSEPRPLSEKDRDKVEKLFRKDRQRQRARKGRDSGTELKSPVLLQKMLRENLQEMCKDLGFICNGKSKKDIINQLLQYHTAGFNHKEWNKLSVEDLREHLDLRKLPKVGVKSELVRRLSQAPLPVLDFELRYARDMKDWLRSVGLATKGKIAGQLPEIKKRYSLAKQRLFEEEAFVQKLDDESLRALDRKAFQFGRKEFASAMGKCLMLARSEDLGEMIKARLSGRERCWVNCIRTARASSGSQGFVPLTPESQLFKHMQKCFAKECASKRFTHLS